ncbi:2047_t:CDS:1, partial [Racocetra fulgida]
GISQTMLQDIWQNTKDPEITKQLERNMVSKEEKTYEILSSFLSWRHNKKTKLN